MGDRVLVVDDEESVRFSFQRFLANAGFEVEVAGNRLEAEVLIAEKSFDVAVVDRILPGLDDGFQIIQQLNSAQSDCQAILISAFPTFESAGRSFSLDAFAYLIKPVGRDEIVRVVREAAEEGRVRRERRLHESLFYSLLGSSTDPILICDLDCRAAFVNPAFTAVFGYQREEVLGRRIPFIPSWDVERSESELRELLGGKQVPTRETRRLSNSGEEIDISMSVSLSVRENGKPWNILFLMRDIRHRQAMEKQICQAQKMEALGALAHGIAHDFGNILHVISARTELLLLNKGVGETAHKSLEQILGATERGIELVNQLMMMGHGDEFVMEPVNLRLTLERVVGLFRRAAGSGIQVELTVADDLKPVLGNTAQIEQCLFNLMLNAKDAIQEKSRQNHEREGDEVVVSPSVIHLKANNARHTNEGGAIGAGNKHGFVMIAISDSGIGIPSEIRHRIFEPFFTTKEARKGTGLGLAAVYRIIKQHGGEITVDSVLRVGTTFKMHLPWAD